MASGESFAVLFHHRGSIKRKTRSGVKFTDKDPLMLQEIVKYDCFTIRSDEDLQVMFHCRRQFPEVRTPELLAKLVDVVSNSRGLNRNTHTIGTVAGSNSRPVGASSSVPVNEPPVEPVASPSFAVDLNCSGGRECAAPASLDDALLGDVDDDDWEPDIIADNSGDDIGASEPVGTGGGSSSGIQQYPPHFSSLDLDAMRQEGVPREPTGFGARDDQGVQYKVVESNYRRYVGKCSEFGNGCIWLIRLSLRQRKGIWEVKRYNGPHTCLATSIFSDHRSLDYHVILAFIMPMVRADASVSIKSLGRVLFELGARSTTHKLIFTDCSGRFHHVVRHFGIESPWIGTLTYCQESPSVLAGEGYLQEVSRTIRSQGGRGKGPVRNQTTIQSTSGEVYRGQNQ
ncbi:uncharacterized protein LOC127743847 [Arachis duranensis]|uniref:Uncharacterized protein LOC127743847 n=1 Tax=Arachis duranensis TaxID=130453 RepID=A0A9C6TMX6_ARADU|nr:uncharacterized protein LOC127743847 [Arachis duranensis]